jgi:hypothetical protein
MTPTTIPCSELGIELKCEGADDLETVFLRKDHVLSGFGSHTITVYSEQHQFDRNGKPYPVVSLDIQTGQVTLNGKPCVVLDG